MISFVKQAVGKATGHLGLAAKIILQSDLSTAKYLCLAFTLHQNDCYAYLLKKAQLKYAILKTNLLSFANVTS